MVKGIERRLAAILSADVAGYSRLMAQDEAATIRAVTTHRDEIAVLVRHHRGRIVDAPGDNVLAEFPAALDAVECAAEVQRVLRTRNASAPPERRMEFRIGVHLGDVAVQDERVYGDGVNIAARLEGLCDPGGLCVSASVLDQVRGKLPLEFEDLGEQVLKNIPAPVRAFGVRAEMLAPEGTASAPPGAGPRGEAASIRGVPFDNMGRDPEQEYFADGITEDLITDLSQLPGLLVIARNSAFTYKGRPVRVQDVGRELGVSHVLEGSVRKAGNRVRINAQLVEAATGHHVWASRYDRDLDDIFAVQDEVTAEIVAALEVNLSESDRRRMQKSLTTSLEAYDLYLRAEAYLRAPGRETNVRARELLQRALELDPEFAAALSRLAYSHVADWIAQWEEADTLDEAVRLAKRSRALDRSRADPHATLATAYVLQGRYELAIEAAREAIRCGPAEPRAHLTLALALANSGGAGDAIGPIETAARLDPYDPSAPFGLGLALCQLQRHAEALPHLERAIELNPEFTGAYLWSITACFALGLEDRVGALADEVRRTSPDFSIERHARRAPIRNPEVLENHLETLRRAGLD